ncbi:MAG: response regulator [Candidatus Cloacimonetes bacterium]|nr:response regulator [Candidatus Cloacimonadota bacterium]
MAKILIVEDEFVIAQDLKMTVESFGHKVVDVVSTGEEAVLKVVEHDPDLILMDIMLEGEMDGIQAVEIIHQNNSIPVIYLTAYADTATLVRAKASKPEAYLLKPWDERELNSTIRLALL